MCPVSMTYSVVPALRQQPDVASEWEPGILSRTYDATFAPPGDEGRPHVRHGDDREAGRVRRAGQHHHRRAVDGGGPGGEYLLTGHKWFCSAPMSDAFLMLAQAPGGLSCFLVPRWQPDGTPNVFRIQRLKDKLGDRSNASSEIELAGTWGRMVGDEGRGVRTIIEMVNHTRLDCSLGSAALMRHGVTEAIHHTSHRDAFGGRLVDKPLMAERAGRPRHRVGGGHRGRAVAGRPVRPGQRRRRARGGAAPARHAGPQVLDLQARTGPRGRSAWSASAGSASSRSPGCPASTGRPRSTASGRARATSSASTCSARSAASPESLDALFGRARARWPVTTTASTTRWRRWRRTSPTPTTSSCGPATLVERLALVLQGVAARRELARDGGRRRVLRHPAGPPGRSGLRHAAPPHRRGRDRRPPRPRRLTARFGRQALARVGCGQGTGVGSG